MLKMPDKPQLGLMRFIGNSELKAVEDSEEIAKKAEEQLNLPEISSLAAHIETAWQAAKSARESSGIEEDMFKCIRQRQGEYDPVKKAYIDKWGGSDVFMQLTNVKCRTATAWIQDVILPPGERPWGLKPTPEPDLPEEEVQKIKGQVLQEVMTQMTLLQEQGISPEAVDREAVLDRLVELREKVVSEIKEQAEAATAEFERRIDDQLTEGGFYDCVAEFIIDLVTFPAAFIKGPLIRRKQKLVWTKDAKGNYTPAVDIKYVRAYERVSPFNMYPSPGAKNLQDGDLIERIQLRPSDLNSMIGVEGYSDEQIRTVLHYFGEGGHRELLAVDSERSDLENRPNEQNDPASLIDGLVYWGSVMGSKLIDWGMSKENIPDESMSYQITAIKIGRFVIMARLNPHPLGHRPYYGTSFDKINDSIFGKCPPLLMTDVQDMCNACARAINNNLGIASGPQVIIDMDRMFPGMNVYEMYPWKEWLTRDNAGKNTPPVDFFQPTSNAETLIRVYDYFANQASEQTGIPKYMHGDEKVGGAGSTASGLSMLMNAASKTLKGVIANIDRDVLSKIIYEHWLNVMLYDRDILKVGDINVVCRASQYLIIEEQLQLRRTEFLKETNNQIDFTLMQPAGRAYVLRETAKSLKLPTDKVVRFSEEELIRQQNQPPPLPAPGEEAPPGPGGAARAPSRTNPPVTLPGGQRAGGELSRMNA